MCNDCPCHFCNTSFHPGVFAHHTCHQLKPLPPLRQDLLAKDLKALQFHFETKGGVRKENIKFWHVEIHVKVCFQNLLHLSSTRQGFGQRSENEYRHKYPLPCSRGVFHRPYQYMDVQSQQIELSRNHPPVALPWSRANGECHPDCN